MLKMDNIKKKFLQSIDIIEDLENNGFTYLKNGKPFELGEYDYNVNDYHHDVTRYTCDGCTMAITTFRDTVVGIRVIKDGIIYDINESINEDRHQIISFSIGLVNVQACVATIRTEYTPYINLVGYEGISCYGDKFLRTYVTINDVSSLPQILICSILPDNEIVMNITDTEEKFDVDKYERCVSQAICGVKNDDCRNYLSNNVRFLSRLIPILLLRRDNYNLELHYGYVKNRIYNSYDSKIENASSKPGRVRELEQRRDKNIRKIANECDGYTDINDCIIERFVGRSLSHQKNKHTNEVSA